MIIGLGLFIGLYAGMRVLEKHSLHTQLFKLSSKKAEFAHNEDDSTASITPNQTILARLFPQDNSSPAHRHHFKSATLALGIATMGVLVPGPTLSLLSLVFILYAAYPVLKKAEHALRNRRLNNDVLVSSFVTLGLLLHYRFITSLSLWIYSWATVILEKAQRQTQHNFAQVLQHIPQAKVWILKENVEFEILFERVEIGDVLILTTGQTVPMDGIIISGMATVDQHLLMGESRPVEKMVGETVFAATTLITGKIWVRVEKIGAQTALAQVAALLNQTVDFQTHFQLKGQQWADQIALPILILSALIFPFYGPAAALVAINTGFGNRIRLLAPLATLNYLNALFQQGILIKDGRALELLREIDTLLFDKTGTLTYQHPQVGRILAADPYSSTEVLRFAAIAEHKINHPVAKAILDRAEMADLDLPVADGSHYEFGYGIQFQLAHQQVQVGSVRLMEKQGFTVPDLFQAAILDIHQQGNSVILVAVEQQVVGLLEIQTTVRPEAQQLMKNLRSLGIQQILIVSGDHEQPTRKLAHDLGIDGYYHSKLPAEKAELVSQLQQQGRTVGFVGDGLNDTLAMKQAHVSISLTGASSIATDVAQVLLLEGNLARLPGLFQLSGELYHNIQRSLTLIITSSVLNLGALFTIQMGLVGSVILKDGFFLVALGNAMLPALPKSQPELQIPESPSNTYPRGRNPVNSPDNPLRNNCMSNRTPKPDTLQLLSADSRAAIDQWLTKYPPDQKQSAVMAALRIAQTANGGWLTTELMDAIADYLDMPNIAVYEVATFYSMYELKPVGKHKICVCTNVSCMLCGIEDIVKHLEKRLGVKIGETTPDKRFTLKEVECLGACGGAPMMQVGDEYHEFLTLEKVDNILNSLK